MRHIGFLYFLCFHFFLPAALELYPLTFACELDLILCFLEHIYALCIHLLCSLYILLLAGYQLFITTFPYDGNGENSYFMTLARGEFKFLKAFKSLL